MSNIIPPHLLTPQDVATLDGIRVNQPGFVDLLQRQRAHVYTQMEAASDTVELHALRGQAGVMTRLIDLIETARESVERLRNSRA